MPAGHADITGPIAVAGATGYIGGRLIPRLLESRYPIRCLVRSPQKLRNRPWSANSEVDIRRDDLSDAATLAANLDGCAAAFYLVHSMIAAGPEYAAKDRALALTFAEAAKKAGVPRIIYLGGLGETGTGLSEHLKSRREVEEALASTGVPVTVFRAAMIIGSGSASFEILRYLVERLPVMVTPKWVSTECQPIAVRNVLEYLVQCLSRPETTGRVFDIGGPDVLRYSQIMQIMAEELHVPRRWIIPVPVLTPRLSSYWIHLVTPLSHRIARPLTEGLKNPVVCRNKEIQSIIPQELLSVREAIHTALQRTAANQIETTWSMAGAIPGDPEWAGGTVFRHQHEIRIAATPAQVFRTISRAGGANGWFAAGWLWRIRGWIDILVGGPGLRRGRRDQETLAYGEALDFWRVMGIEPNRRLTLRAEMKLPGEAQLEFRISPDGDHNCSLVQTASFRPRGLFGLLYWYAVLPFHHFVFQGMLRGIRNEAIRSSESGESSGSMPMKASRL
jgi:uncharacterized protein YbjT (DUF2867 family)/uncharacterized protein YndB with AHSA1/START domain